MKWLWIATSDERGQALAEYALASAAFALAMIAGVALLRSAGASELANTASGWVSFASAPP